MDIIFIRGLKCETILGVYDWERVARRPVVIDLEIGAASREAFEHLITHLPGMRERIEAVISQYAAKMPRE